MNPPTLADVLDSKADAQIFTNLKDEDQLEQQAALIDGMCVECQDMPASLFCLACEDDMCDVCFTSLHRNGNRKLHQAKKMPAKGDEMQVDMIVKAQVVSDAKAEVQEQRDDGVLMTAADISISTLAANASNGKLTFTERANYIPVRLTLKERKALRLLEAALIVSDYTDKIDIVGNSFNKHDRIVYMIKDLCAILCGLVVANDYSTGQTLIKDNDYKFNETYFQRVFEIGRRHKIMNPALMRDTYGKLVFLLMDSASNEQVRDMLEFSCVSPIVTVHSVLSQSDALALLNDPLMEAATKQILVDTFKYADKPTTAASLSSPSSAMGFFMRKNRSSAKPGSDDESAAKQNSTGNLVRRKTRREIDQEIKIKERAIDHLARKYSSKQISDETIKQCLYSIGDNNAYLAGNRDPIEKMLALLKQYFNPSHSNPSIAISSGQDGARLSHSHERQYYYVLQSLELWREITINMFKLWYLAEQDMLDHGNSYRLRDTGQGLQRIQPSPRVYKEIHRILSTVMARVGQYNWVGSSVVHLGDTNVPNALVFIDKYTQVPRILAPIVSCIEKIDNELMRDSKLAAFVNTTFESAESLKLRILQDFFRSGFDGSGADNFFDAGSCIDGRMTSAWNWANTVEKKPYYPVMLLTGFVGFDGEF